jgi:hypothetical protein
LTGYLHPEFVTLDRNQGAAADKEGFRVIGLGF